MSNAAGARTAERFTLDGTNTDFYIVRDDGMEVARFLYKSDARNFVKRQNARTDLLNPTGASS